MTRELFIVSGSPYAWRAQLALEHKALPFVTNFLSFSTNELQAPAYLALNPRGRVPTLRDGEVVIYESLAVLAYLERRYPDPPLFGRTAQETGQIWQSISEYTSYIDAAVEGFILPLYDDRVSERRSAFDEAVAGLSKELPLYEHRLSQHDFLVGSELTAADLVVYPHVASIERAASKPAAQALGLPFSPLRERWPAIAAWQARIEALPYFAKTYPRHWR